MENNHAKIENDIGEDLQKILSVYFKEFLNKFDNLNNGLRVVEVLLKAYQMRYDKFKEKFGNINDLIANKYEEQKDFLIKTEKLDTLDANLGRVEVKIQNIMSRLDLITNLANEKVNVKSTQITNPTPQLKIRESTNEITQKANTPQI